MNARPLRIGFVRLVDAAPVIVAHEMGFAREEGLELSLEAAPNWSTLRDRLSFGQLEAAHMLAPVPVAGALGLGGGMASATAEWQDRVADAGARPAGTGLWDEADLILEAWRG